MLRLSRWVKGQPNIIAPYVAMVTGGVEPGSKCTEVRPQRSSHRPERKTGKSYHYVVTMTLGHSPYYIIPDPGEAAGASAAAADRPPVQGCLPQTAG